LIGFHHIYYFSILLKCFVFRVLRIYFHKTTNIRPRGIIKRQGKNGVYKGEIHYHGLRLKAIHTEDKTIKPVLMYYLKRINPE